MRSRFDPMICFTVLGLLFSIALVNTAAADPDLIAWYRFDGDATDSSGNNLHGTVVGDATYVAGVFGEAIDLPGSATYVDCGNDPAFDVVDELTVTAWVRMRQVAGEWRTIIAKGDNSWRVSTDGTTRAMHFSWTGEGRGWQAANTTITLGVDEWHHVCAIYDRQNGGRVFIDGVQDAVNPDLDGIDVGTFNVFIGENPQAANRFFDGVIDDVMIFSRALGDEEIQDIIAGRWHVSGASGPQPVDEAVDVPRDVILSWTPLDTATTRDVYFGMAFDDVNDASRTDPRGVLVSEGQTATTYEPPRLLDFGQIYFWRVDEINAPPDSTVFKGNVWSFTTEPRYYVVENIEVTASAPADEGSGALEVIVDGTGLIDGLHSIVDSTMWVSEATDDPIWLQFDFDRVYKLYGMHVWNYNHPWESILGLGIQEATIEYATEPNEWIALGDYELDQATGRADYAGQLVDLDGLAARSVRINVNTTHPGATANQAGLSEIQFLYKPVFAREPQPADGATGVAIDATLSWRPGREADSHEIHFGTDSDAVADGEALFDTVAVSSYELPTLDLATSYYWMIVEVNEAETPPAWASDVWSFSTPEFLVVDNFESYTGDEDAGEAIWQAWVDGYGVAANGSQVGHDDRPFVGRDIFRSGSQSMPFYYGQEGATTSEATLTLPSMNWTAGGATTLVLYFHGSPTNDAGQLYLKINGNEIAYSGPADDIQRRRWNQWNVDLASVSGGVSAVQTLTLGVRGPGTGLLYFDDVRLYKEAPEVPVPVDPGTAGLVAYYPFDNNVQDASGNANHGTLVGAPTYAAGPAGYGQALSLNGTTDAVDLGDKAVWNPTGSFSVSLWANAAAWNNDWAHVMIGNRGEDGIGWQVRRWGATENIAFTTRGVGSDDTQSVMAMPLNEWVHITCVYDNAANTKTIYINGLQDQMVTTTADATIAATTHNTYIGARANSGNTEPQAFFAGLLDEIRVYDRALSPGEARYLAGDQ